jgi:hypothetical protein
MTSVDDLLFEPITGPSTSPINSTGSSIIATGIMKRPDATAIEIITANPKQIYLDAASEVMDHATACHPHMFDRRNPSTISQVPAAAMRLDDLVYRFHDGEKLFWITCPTLTPPRQCEFAGRFGHLKVQRLAQQLPYKTQVAAFIADWFWLDTTEGQMSAVEIGLLVTQPNRLMHFAFLNKHEAQKYYTT